MRILVAIAPVVGGRALAASVGQALPGHSVSVVEDLDEDLTALSIADVLIVAHCRVTAAHFEAAPRLRMIQCPSHGFDEVDVQSARARGVLVCNVGSAAGEEFDVADHTIMLMLAVTRRLVEGHEALRNGEWPLLKMRNAGIISLRGKILGLVGFGAIGKEVALRAVQLGMRVRYVTRTPVPSEIEYRYSAERRELDDLLAESDIVSLHVPLGDATRALIDERRLALMKPTAFLVNTARGAVVDERALARALAAGRLAGAGIDVFDPEPPPADHPLLRAPNVVLSPHIAASTNETFPRIALAALDNVRRFLSGQPVLDVVNGVGPSRVR